MGWAHFGSRLITSDKYGTFKMYPACIRWGRHMRETLWIWLANPCRTHFGYISNVFSLFRPGQIGNPWQGTFKMYPTHVHWAHCGYLLPVPTMYSAWAQQVNDPLSPVPEPQHKVFVWDLSSYVKPSDNLLEFLVVLLEGCQVLDLHLTPFLHEWVDVVRERSTVPHFSAVSTTPYHLSTASLPPLYSLPTWLSLFDSRLPYFRLPISLLFPYGLRLALLYLPTTHHSFPVLRTMTLDVLLLCWYPITFTFLIGQCLSASHIYFPTILMIVGFLLRALLGHSWEPNTVRVQSAFSIYSCCSPGDSL